MSRRRPKSKTAELDELVQQTKREPVPTVVSLDDYEPNAAVADDVFRVTFDSDVAKGVPGALRGASGLVFPAMTAAFARLGRTVDLATIGVGVGGEHYDPEQAREPDWVVAGDREFGFWRSEQPPEPPTAAERAWHVLTCRPAWRRVGRVFRLWERGPTARPPEDPTCERWCDDCDEPHDEDTCDECGECRWSHRYLNRCNTCDECGQHVHEHPRDLNDGEVPVARWYPVKAVAAMVGEKSVARVRVVAEAVRIPFDNSGMMLAWDLARFAGVVATPGIRLQKPIPPSPKGERRQRGHILAHKVYGGHAGAGIVPLEDLGRRGKHRYWRCRCIACGAACEVRQDRIRSGKTTSCGCVQRRKRDEHYDRHQRRKGVPK